MRGLVLPILPRDEHCCGCAACFNACAHASITMTQDEFGFFVPLIDTSTCTECKACESACPTLPFLNFAPYNEVRRKSVFPLTLAENVAQSPLPQHLAAKNLHEMPNSGELNECRKNHPRKARQNRA